MKKIKIFIVLIFLILSILFFINFIDNSIKNNAKDRIFKNTQNIQVQDVALVLGTSKYSYGYQNLFYNYRIEAVKKLWDDDKIKIVLISGDNSRKDYSEPEDMKKDLIQFGIPEDKIYLDYAGFRTLDSIVRAEEIFDLKKYVIVSQKFHCERALYIADNFEHDTSCFLAEDVVGVFQTKVLLREKLARVKAWLDLNIFFTEPKFLGEKVKIN